MHANPNLPETSQAYIYAGRELDFDAETLAAILNRYFPFYRQLHVQDQPVFIHRLKKFIRRKQFHIYTSAPYREMPLLVSAAAIQLTFGLRHYLLPWFQQIHIYPSAYAGFQPLRLLIGNVQGNSISISWHHFFKETLDDQNGHNVGLHEMAHALHVQKTYYLGKKGKTYRETFWLFDSMEDAFRQQETRETNRLYSDYDLTNVDEFWAKSVELFFECPQVLFARYSRLYIALVQILQQDPANYPAMGPCHPLKKSNRYPRKHHVVP